MQLIFKVVHIDINFILNKYVKIQSCKNPTGSPIFYYKYSNMVFSELYLILQLENCFHIFKYIELMNIIFFLFMYLTYHKTKTNSY